MPRATVLLIALLLACAPSGTKGTASSSRTPLAQGAIEQLRAKGSVLVAIRVEAPPPNRAAGDPAHSRKRAFEMAVATLVLNTVLGPSVKVQFQGQGGDRLAALAGSADLAMVTETPASKDRALISPAYARNSVVLAVREGSSIVKLEELAGKSVGVAMDELATRDLAQTFFQGRAVSAVTIDTYQGVNGATSALEDGRAVALVGDGIGVTFLATDRKLVTIAEVAPRPYVIAVRQSAPDLAAAVSTALQDALRGGAVRDAASKAGFPYTAP